MFGALREKSMDVPGRGMLETEHGPQEREKAREGVSEGWARIYRVRSWIWDKQLLGVAR